jgi:hypothetical protein
MSYIGNDPGGKNLVAKVRVANVRVANVLIPRNILKEFQENTILHLQHNQLIGEKKSFEYFFRQLSMGNFLITLNERC